MDPEAPDPEPTTSEGSAAAEPSAGRRPVAAAWLVGLGGLAIVAGALLPWALIDLDLTDLGGRRTREVAFGFESTHGWILLALGVVVSALAFRVPRAGGGRVAAALALVAGAAVVTLVGGDLRNLEEDARRALAEDVAVDSDLTADEAEGVLVPRMFLVGGAGIYIGLAGGWVASLGGAAGALERRRRRARRTPDGGEEPGGLGGPGADDPALGPPGEGEHAG